jgi:hypothetical protein
MYDAPIPMINYVLATITASVLAYATAMDINNNENNGSATDNLPSLNDSYAKEPEPAVEPEPEPVNEPASAVEVEPVKEPEPVEEMPMAEAQIVPPAQPEKNNPLFGGKRHNPKIKKTIRNTRNNKKRKQTRNKNHIK